MAADGLFVYADYRSRRVTALLLHVRRAVLLYQLGEVALETPRQRNRLMVRGEPVRRDLRPSRDTAVQFLDELPCVVAIALADVEARHEFRFAVDGREDVGVTHFGPCAFRERRLFLHGYEPPLLIDLEIAERQIVDVVDQKLVALFAGLDHQPQDGAFVQPCHPRRGPNTHAFQEQPEGERRLVERSLFCGQRFWIGECLAAFGTAITLLAVASLSELRSRLSTLRAVHRISPSLRGESR